MRNKMSLFALTIILVFMFCLPALAVDKEELQTNVSKAAAYILKSVPEPQIGSVGGEWAVLGLARSGYKVPEAYYQNYYARVVTEVQSGQGLLHEKKITEYSRLIVALTAIGKDPRNVGGYNLLTPLGDFDQTIWQGLNGPVWALLALDSGNYAMPENPQADKQASRQMYVDEILSRQLADGGWSLTGKGGDSTPADPDITGMALQALAKYQDQAAVKKATAEALNCMSQKQETDGGFSSWEASNLESMVQMVVAFGELGLDLEDSRFVKNGHTLLSNLMSYFQADGSFKHIPSGGGDNQMSSEQGFYALVSALRLMNNQNSLYRMSDALTLGDSLVTDPDTNTGLPGKNSHVQVMPVTVPDKSFSDVADSKDSQGILALASRGIINGQSADKFAPAASMTRAEFATIITRGLGLAAKDTGVFKDVAGTAWYAGYIGTANAYGIVQGVGGGNFKPAGTITRQEAAVMVARGAKLCGLDTDLSTAGVRDMLAQFGDYMTLADWAQEALAFCYQEEILDQAGLDIQPLKPILRSEIAQMLYNMLTRAKLI